MGGSSTHGALHPLTMPCVPLVVSVLLRRAVGSFHRRG
jgi:hypothetical protein